MNLTFDLYLVAGCILSEFYSQFLSRFTLAIRTFSSLLYRNIRFCHLTYNIKCNLLFITVSRVLFLISCIMKQSNCFPVTERTVACFNHLCDIHKRLGDQDIVYQTTLTRFQISKQVTFVGNL